MSAIREEKENLSSIIKANIQELQEGMNRHCALLDAIVSDQGLEGKNIQHLVAQCPVRDRERDRQAQLTAAIQKAIDVLEESRKAFKSKRLEGLRKDLTRLLIDQK